MAFLLPLTSVPELAAFSRPVRRLLVQRSVFALYADWRAGIWLQIIIPIGAGLLGALFALWVMGCLLSPPSPATVRNSLYAQSIGTPIGCAVGALVWLHIRARRLRPYLQRAIEEHENEAKRSL